MLLQELVDFVVEVSDDEHSVQDGMNDDRQSSADSATGSTCSMASNMWAGKRQSEAAASTEPSPQRRRTVHHEEKEEQNQPGTPEEGAAGSDSDAEFCFEDDSSCDEFIPRGATRARAEILVDNTPMPMQLPRLPSELRAMIPADGLSAPVEFTAVGLLQEGGVASKALRFVARAAQPLSEAALPALGKRLRQWGYGSNALTKVLDYVRNEAPIIVHIDLESRLEKLRADTHYRNQFETGTTCGSNNLEKRKAWEDRLFQGIYDKAEPRDRVKYGVLNMVNDPCGISSVSKQYGKDYLVLRGIRLRTTFSDKDSCNQGQLASCEWYAHVLQQYSDVELRAVTEVALGDRLFVDSDVLATSAGGYKEVQIHGELMLEKHVEMVVAHPCRRDTPVAEALSKWCEQLGIRLEFMPHRMTAGAGNVPSGLCSFQIEPETPLWRWRVPNREWAPWIRFNAFESSALEMQSKSQDHCLPARPIGILASGNLQKMAATASIGGQEIDLELQRCTAGAGAQQRAAELSRSAEKATWEWCASEGGNGAWSAYNKLSTKMIETAFQQGRDLAQILINKVLYQIDLVLMVQVNMTTGYRRLVRRTPVIETSG
mmetsp:Transcript_22777/g.43783  ORF Transcript_22777/g.43783 Transcript_22777/m.43783 type:complete len:601 (-) Transcript_22777:36-1838(-)